MIERRTDWREPYIVFVVIRAGLAGITAQRAAQLRSATRERPAPNTAGQLVPNALQTSSNTV
jgi:hypothetical protein